MLITKDEIDMMPVRALSWKQPYATMMLLGKAETRVWNTIYRGLVLICSSQKAFTYNQIMEVSGGDQYRRIKQKLATQNYPVIDGHAITIGRLSNCSPMAECLGKYDAFNVERVENMTFVKFYWDLFVFEFKDVRPIQPIPWKGSQRWRPLTQEDKNKIILL